MQVVWVVCLHMIALEHFDILNDPNVWSFEFIYSESQQQ